MGKYSEEIFVGMGVSVKNIELFVLKGTCEDGEHPTVFNTSPQHSLGSVPKQRSGAEVFDNGGTPQRIPRLFDF